MLLLLTALNRLQAQDDEWKTTSGVGVVSEQVFRGVERSAGAAQVEGEMAHDGFRANLSASEPFRSSGSGEADLSAAYARKLSARLTIEAVSTQYFLGQTAPGATRWSTEVGLKATWTSESGWSAGVAGYHDFRLRADTAIVSASYSLPLTHWGAFLECSSYLGWADGSDLRPDSPGPRIGDSYSFYGADVQLPYRVGGHTTMVAGIHFTDTIGQSRSWSSVDAPGRARGWVSFAINFDF